MLSKSDYLLFLKHPALLWLKKHDKDKIPPTDANLQAIFDAGNLFEKYAEKLFPGIVRLGFESGDYSSLPTRTKSELDNGTKVLAQGRFEVENITCICDVLVKVGENTFDLFEIKSSTKAKTEHEFDLAFQTIVLEKSGYISFLLLIGVNSFSSSSEYSSISGSGNSTLK